jgi:uncharacterized protein involved in exopolysaccharide biosynthesis
MPNQPFRVSPWVLLFLLAPIWIAIPACTGNEMRASIAPLAPKANEEDSTEARTIKSRRKQRLRQQRCEKQASAKLQAVQSKLAQEQARYTSDHPIVRDLVAQKTNLTAALENCKN